jgi:hypothetical protein
MRSDVKQHLHDTLYLQGDSDSSQRHAEAVPLSTLRVVHIMYRFSVNNNNTRLYCIYIYIYVYIYPNYLIIIIIL